MPIGSPRPSAGRPKGVRNVKTVEQIAKVEAAGITPLEYMLGVLRDKSAETALRMDAAKAAAPYVHARLSAIEAVVTGALDLTHEVRRTVVDPRHSDG
jgi:hypothetical protein